MVKDKNVQEAKTKFVHKIIKKFCGEMTKKGFDTMAIFAGCVMGSLTCLIGNSLQIGRVIHDGLEKNPEVLQAMILAKMGATSHLVNATKETKKKTPRKTKKASK